MLRYIVLYLPLFFFYLEWISVRLELLTSMYEAIFVSSIMLREVINKKKKRKDFLRWLRKWDVMATEL